MNDFQTKLDLINQIFSQPVEMKLELEEDEKKGLFHVLQHGKSYGGVYNGRRFLYSKRLIETLPIEKLESFIKKQINYEKAIT